MKVLCYSLKMVTLIMLLTACDGISRSDQTTIKEIVPAPQAKIISAIYTGRCSHCHDNNGFGEQAIRARLGDKRAKIIERDDLPADFIRSVVRNGYLAMPPMSRAEVSNTELEEIITFLTLKQ